MAKHIVLGIEPVDFADENGERIQGAKVHYLQDEPENFGQAKGFLPLNLFMRGDHVSKFTQVPGVYDMDFGQRRDRQGKPIMMLRDVSFVKAFDLSIGGVNHAKTV
ncbi:hypothetical protein [Schinkia azotoformans]|uniref:hypothetical protein n=1 Tax=Schinkia azotoformans TaxID=1454 RepID=UPI002DB75F22|nr:hypothetical protein [Schinkia azotoformans]MEC1746784.1 hypothetical protein [Schinkia azotoformans]